MKIWQTRSKIFKALCIISPFLYFPFFVATKPLLSTSANLLGILPIFFFGYVWGWRGGLLAGGLISFTVTFIQVSLFSEDIGLLTTVVSAMVAASAGGVFGQLFEQQVSLRISREELEEAHELALLFIATMTHELRTPLNAILNFSEMHSLGMVGPVNEEQKKLLDQTTESGRYLLNMINDILDMSKIQTGMFTLLIEDEIDFNTEIEAAILMAQTMLQNKPVELVVDIEKNLPPIHADKRRLRQILINLLSNAAKFTDAGTVTLMIENHKDHLCILVKDTGPGISEEEQDIIFKPYMQSKAGILSSGGTGLGLPITREIAQAHGGKIWVESALGEGAAFFVALPVFSTPS